MVGLSGFEHHYPKRVSSDMKMRTSLTHSIGAAVLME